MGTAIAFLSGKGGSGKTTLALSMADLMSKCKIKTLLIDCDLSTNGATYFFESQLSAKDSPSSVTSFYDYLSCAGIPDHVAITKINSYFEFLPSIPGVSDANKLPPETISLHIDVLFNKLQFILSKARETYDVILFDCQAGYTNLLAALLPQMDVDIFVLEADSISASAMRNLHLKAGNYFGQARVYQVFNKASVDEYETYSKIVGTFFINIGTLLFDWKIRQAFSRSQIPDLENTSAKYGSDLCEICRVVLTDTEIQRKINAYSLGINYRQLEEERNEVEKKLDELIRNPYAPHKRNTKILFSVALSSLLFILVGVFLALERYSLNNRDIPYIAIMIIILSTFTVSSLGVFLGNIREDRDAKHLYERKIKDLSERMKRLEHEINGNQSKE